MIDLTLEVEPGQNIGTVSDMAQTIADHLLHIGFSARVSFQFNSVRCVALPGGKADVLAEEQQRLQNYTPVAYSTEEANDAE